MSNIQVESDLKEILKDLKDGQTKILEKVNDIDLRLTKVETLLPEMDKKIDRLQGNQTAQIWTLIGILITAVGGFIVAVARQVLTFSP